MMDPIATIVASCCAGSCDAWACTPALPSCTDEADRCSDTPKLAMVTGGNRGVGLGVAKVLARRGWNIVLLCRDVKSADSAAKKLRCSCSMGTVETCYFDLDNLASVRAAARKYHEQGVRVAALVNNAADVSPRCMATNYLGPFAFTLLMLDLLTPDGIVVNVSSCAHAGAPSPVAPSSPTMTADATPAPAKDAWSEYVRSKAANLMFTLALSRRLLRAQSGVRVVACHPGVLPTRLWKFGYSETGGFDAAALRSLLAKLDTLGAPDLLPLHCVCCKSARTAGAGVAFLAAGGGTPACGCIPSLPAVRRAAVRSGGYYQQLCCALSVPVRPTEQMFDVAQQEALWRWSMDALRAAPEAGAECVASICAVAQSIGVVDTTSPPADALPKVGWAGSELLAYAAASPVACFC